MEWEIDQKLKRLATLRGRIGYLPAENFLVYATAGFAWGQTEAHQVIHYPKVATPFVNGFGSADETHTGYAVGGGAEWALTPAFSIKAEYLYVDLGDASYHFVGKAGNPPSVPYADDRAPSSLDLHTVRIGLNYKFGREEAAPLK